MSSLPTQSIHPPKPPRTVFNTIFAFPPNRDTLGGTAYFIVGNEGNILIDSPPWDETNQNFLQSHGGVRWLFFTHRGGIGKQTPEIQESLGCEVVIHEQEAYLLPGLMVTKFQEELILNSQSQVIWTPGHSPGSACLYYSEHGGVLFSGRHLIPNHQGEPLPLRTAKTFHWRRQINSVQLLLERFDTEMFQYICPGANLGFLRGKQMIDEAKQRLDRLDLKALLQTQPLL